MRFVGRKHKDALLKQAEKLKGTGLEINERLTTKEPILRKQQHKIQATWTRNGRVEIRLNGRPEEAKVMTVRELIDLEKYK